MKTFLLAVFCICFLSATAPGQAAGTLSNQITVYSFQSHPEKATQRGLAKPDEIMESSCNVSAKGERPLWEVADAPDETPLGDVARMFRDQHAGVKKAEVIFENF
jgi:hypothetical protein